MNRRLILIALLVMQTLVCPAQMDIELQQLSMRQTRSVNGQPVRVIAQLQEGISLASLDGRLKDLGVKTLSDYGRICVLSIPVSSLKATSDLEEVEYLSTDRKVSVQNNLAREDMHVDKVQNIDQASDLGLDQTYDGTGVLVGVVDTGIDFNHPAFLDSEGNTRVRMAQIYDTNEGETPKDMAAIRQTYTEPDDIAQLESDGTPESHGSHTSCTAAGSPVAMPDGTIIQGMAPGAELLLSSMYSEEGDSYNSYIMDAIYCQLQYAEKAGKPIAINCSVGNIADFCDGKNPFITFLESVAGPGKVICFSTGNSMEMHQAIEFEPQSDSDILHTVITPMEKNRDFELKIISEDTTEFQVKLFIENMMKKQWDFQYETADGASVSESDIVFYSHDPLHDNRFVAILKFPKGQATGGLAPEIGLKVTGKKGKRLRLVSEEVEFYSPGIQKITVGSGINSYGRQCETDSVISVGAYVSRENVKNWEGISNRSNARLHNPSSFSSYGTTVTGKSIPDIIAPGEFLLSALNTYDFSIIDQNSQTARKGTEVYTSVTVSGRKCWYGWMSGTSMSCPCTTGVIALWLQADPTLGPGAVRSILQETSLVTSDLKDKYPASSYGNGMLKADEGLKYIVGNRTGVPAVELPSWSDSAIYELSPRIYIQGGKKYLR